ncbi:CBS domain-containing protein [Frankia nepalensis]|uniref:CBS domain-containing protein n=2 Tax=Frankia nepalensis TaxID=1836974 RepID=A0A937UVU1_9ACTN|nr:CBS domain-containing protein [Frankia nepalensis]MBL7632656.1 CBS domain-containing protein [Frankia nepalensis]
MTRDPATIQADQPVVEAARLMRASDAGDVIVFDNGRVAGILTDRDIAMRVVAEGRDPAATPVREACSGELTTVTPATTIVEAVRLIRANAVRRLPVLDRGHLVGVVSIGDLAIERAEDSALAQVSAATGND